VVVLAAVYLLTGIAYWVLWAAVRLLYARLLTPELGEALPAVDHFLRVLVFTALAALTLYTAIALLFEAVWYRGEVRRGELEGALLQLRLDQARSTALRAQVDPVFLRDAFAIASDLMASDVPGARKVLSDLSELLRVALGRNGALSIDLRRELDLADRFIGIRQARRQKPVPVELRIDEAAYGAAVPSLLIQPLLAAAFDWIAESCEEDGRIVVAARAVGREVLVAVTVSCPAGSGRVQPRAGRADMEQLRRQLGGPHGDRTELTVVQSRTGGLEMRARVPLAYLDPR
jgi:two-component system, LytTR family, sensor kinase